MRRYIIPFVFAGFFAFFFGNTILKAYQTNVKPVFKEEQTVYVLQQGVYSSLESAQENTKNISHYIYIKDDDYYRVFVGMSKNKKNAEKLEGMYKKMGNNIYVKEITIDNADFLKKLDNYDSVVENASEYITMISVMQEALADFEELVIQGGSSV